MRREYEQLLEGLDDLTSPFQFTLGPSERADLTTFVRAMEAVDRHVDRLPDADRPARLQQVRASLRGPVDGLPSELATLLPPLRHRARQLDVLTSLQQLGDRALEVGEALRHETDPTRFLALIQEEGQLTVRLSLLFMGTPPPRFSAFFLALGNVGNVVDELKDVRRDQAVGEIRVRPGVRLHLHLVALLVRQLPTLVRLHPRPWRIPKWAWPLVVIGLAGCPQRPIEPDPGLDTTTPASPGEARAGVVRDPAALFGGVNAEGRVGDIKLYNHLVQVIIQGPYRGHGYVDVGGGIIDADLVRSGVLGRDTVEDLFLAFNRARVAHADTVTVVDDGASGGPAVVRAAGTDVVWAFFQNALELGDPLLDDLGLEITTEFSLPPDSHTITVTTTLHNPGTGTVSFHPQDGLMASGEDLLTWSSGAGVGDLGSGLVDAIGVTGLQGEATVSLQAESGGLRVGGLDLFLGDLGILTPEHPEQTLEAGATATLTRFVTIAPDIVTAEADRWRRDRPVGSATGRITDIVTGDPIPGVRLWFVHDEDVAGFALTEADGTYRAELPVGPWEAWAVARAFDEHVQLPEGAGRLGPFSASHLQDEVLHALDGSAPALPLSWATHHQTPEPVPIDIVAGAEATTDLMMSPLARLHVDLDDGDQAVPAVVEVRYLDPPPALPSALADAFGLPTSASRAAWAWTATGAVDLPLLPGRFEVIAVHSWRHERASGEITATAGETTTLRLQLDPVVPRDGWLALDPHLHGAPSFDGALPMSHRLVTCAATGVDLPVTTDHDRHADYAPLATALGLDGRMQVIPGVEVTSFVRGHFNLYPLPSPPPGAANGGALSWWTTPPTTTQDLFASMRATGGPDTLVAMNHPRAPGMSSFAGYDAATAEPDRPHLWSWDFDTFELMNGGVDNLAAVRDDWFSFLDTGRVKVPTGSSDTHYRFIPCGYARTDVFLGTDDPAAVTPVEVRDAIMAGRVVVANGTTLRATVEGELPGATVVGGSVTVHATVQAPSWIVPGVLRIYGNGEVLHTEAIPTEPADETWLDGSWTLALDTDSWIVIEVQGDVPMGDAMRNFLPYAATNAFFVDVDGDGWTAPGLP